MDYRDCEELKKLDERERNLGYEKDRLERQRSEFNNKYTFILVGLTEGKYGGTLTHARLFTCERKARAYHSTLQCEQDENHTTLFKTLELS